MFDENLDVFLQDFGVPVINGTYRCTGILDQPDETLSMGGVNVLSTMYRLQLKSTDVSAGGFATDSAITVGGAAFKVRDVLLEGDGVFSSLTLTKT